jgi:hypothetical protein
MSNTFRKKQVNQQPITIKKSVKCEPRASFWRFLLIFLVAGVQISLFSAGAQDISAGFLFDRFQLTLEAGCRTEAAGPFYYSQQTDSEKVWAIPPFLSSYRNAAVESHEDDFLYPLFSSIRYGHEQRWQFGQLISTATGQEPNESDVKRFTLYPVYFQQRAPDTNLNYTAIAPFYGHLKGRLFHDEIYFILFPAFGETRKRDVVTDNYFYPFVHVRHGDGLYGWQFWPFIGREHKAVTTDTNGFGDTTLNPGHDQSFVFWPLYLKQNNGLGTDDPERFRASIPLFVISRSPQRDSTSVFWPFFASIDDRAKQYHEWQGPWPFVIFTHGAGKTTSRVWPLFSQSHNRVKESDSYLWPLYTYKRIQSDPLDQQRTRVLIYLYSRVTEKNTETGASRTRLDMWPFFTWHRDFNGNERLQVLAPLEPAVPDNRGIERNWSPLWSLWRTEASRKTGASSQSLLWNLYRRETAPGYKKVSLLFGLFQYQSDQETERTRLFYLTVHRTAPPSKK